MTEGQTNILTGRAMGGVISLVTSEAPAATAGRISLAITSSRHLQLGVTLLF